MFIDVPQLFQHARDSAYFGIAALLAVARFARCFAPPGCLSPDHGAPRKARIKFEAAEWTAQIWEVIIVALIASEVMQDLRSVV